MRHTFLILNRNIKHKNKGKPTQNSCFKVTINSYTHLMTQIKFCDVKHVPDR